MGSTSMVLRIGGFRRRLGRYWRCQEGNAAVEFAFLLTPLCLLLIGMLEVAMLMFAQALVEGGLREAARYGMTGQDPVGLATREDEIIAIIDGHTLNLIDLTDAVITMQVYDSFSDVDEPEPWTDANSNGNYDLGETYDDLNGNAQWDDDRGTIGVGNATQIVQYTIQFDWTPMTPYLGVLFGEDGSIAMRASVVVRNEPFLAI